MVYIFFIVKPISFNYNNMKKTGGHRGFLEARIFSKSNDNDPKHNQKDKHQYVTKESITNQLDYFYYYY